MTDVGLPGMDGIELLQTVRARTDGSWIPTLVFTGSLDEATQMRALRRAPIPTCASRHPARCCTPSSG
jgi:CheY-like chemotaxis protein